MRYVIPGILWLVSASIVLPRTASAADSVAVIAVSEPPGPSAKLAELTNQLRLALNDRSRGSLTVLTAAEIKERMTGEVPHATLAALDRAYSAAVTTFQKGDFEDAVRNLRGIVKDLDELPDGPETFSRWRKAILRLARSEQTLGRTKDAKELLERLVRVHPSIKVDANEYPPSFRKLVNKARASVTARGMRRLTVLSAVKARVFVEGRQAGSTPLTMDLPRGRFRLSATAGSLRIPSFVVDLTKDGKTVTLGFALVQALRPANGPGLALPEANRTKSIMAAGSFLGVDKLVAAQLVTEKRGEQLSGTLIDLRRDSVLREARIHVRGRTASSRSLGALASFMATGQGSALLASTTPARVLARSLEPAMPSPPGIDLDLTAPVVTPKTSRKRGWAALGVAALGVGLGAVAVHEGSSASSSYERASSFLRPDGTLWMGASTSYYKDLLSEGDSARTAAFISGGAAVACATVSGILGYLSYKQTGEIGPFRF